MNKDALTVTTPPARGWNVDAIPGDAPPGAEELARLLDDVRGFIGQFVVFQSEEQAVAVTLWIAGTWFVAAFDFAAYLAINSPVKRCGKSTLLDCLALLCRRPWQAISASAAVLFRKIERDCPTLLLDEVDTIFSGGKGDESKEDLRAVLNAGFQRGAKVPRCVGPQFEIQEFSVFCPKALAGIGKLPDTVADRSIPVVLARAARGQRIAKFRRREVTPEATSLAEAFESLAGREEILSVLAAARPSIPGALGARSADICEPLLAVADLAGGEWPTLARGAFVKLFAGEDAEDDNLGSKLLAACRTAFAEEETDRLPSHRLLALLVDQEGSGPWASWWEADINRNSVKGPAGKLARMLKPFGVAPKDFREDGAVKKGYFLESFQEAFDRYLSD